MQFSLDKQPAKIRNINLRKEGASDDAAATLAADIKVECEDMPASHLKALCPVDAKERFTIVDSLFNDKGVPRFYGIDNISLGAVLENVEVSVGGHRFASCGLKGFEVLKTLDGAKVNLLMTIQCHPTEQQVGALAEKIKEEVKVTVLPQPELALGNAA